MKQAQPLPLDLVQNHFDRYFQKLQAKHLAQPLQIRVFSQKLGLDYCYPSDSTNQPYHIASIGKVFTAVLIQMLAERGHLSIQDPIRCFFSPAELDRLFVYRNVDYSQQVTVEHLMGHTSGINDYFEGKAAQGKTFAQEVLDNANHHWTPWELVNYTRENQAAVGMPGKKFLYSDTGYILLGMIIEKVTGKTFDQNLREEIFLPLQMNDSYLMFYAEPVNGKREIEKIWFLNREVSEYESLSCDWSGGGIISTTADLLKFNQALRGGRLIQPASLRALDTFSHRFRLGIHYGLGMMEIHFNEFFFLLGRLPKIQGHIGILATHMYYDASSDAHIIMNFGSTARMQESFMALIEIENHLQKLR